MNLLLQIVLAEEPLESKCGEAESLKNKWQVRYMAVAKGT